MPVSVPDFMSVTRFRPFKIPKYIYRKRKRDLNPIIDCECGCGNFKMLYDIRGRISYYLEGHKVAETSVVGRKLSKSTKIKIGLAVSKIPRTLEWRQKIGASNKGKTLGRPSQFKGIKNRHSKETIEKIRNARRNQIIPKTDTKPERMIQIALSLQGIKFETHKPLIGQPDIFIEPNICIFIDGCYWHGCKDCYPELIVSKRIFQTTFSDISNTHKLNELGYNVIRIREHLIKDKNSDSVKNIINLIRTTIIRLKN